MIRIGIYGYGHLGRAAEKAAQVSPSFEPVCIFSHRARELSFEGPARFSSAPILPAEELPSYKDKVDILLNCGSTAWDLNSSSAKLAEHFCIVDSFDCHEKIHTHCSAVNEAARRAGTLCVTGAGWDPGLFSILRILMCSFFPDAHISTFWGPGISLGHSALLRRLPGVADACQYTIPSKAALRRALEGLNPEDDAETHHRICCIAPLKDADRNALAESVHRLPEHFGLRNAEIRFTAKEELPTGGDLLPHGGTLFCHSQNAAPASMEVKFHAADNPGFTAGVMLACARAAFRLHSAGESGCRTMADLAPSLFLPDGPNSQPGAFL